MERKTGDFLDHDAQGRGKGPVFPYHDLATGAGAEYFGEASEEGDGVDAGGAASVEQLWVEGLGTKSVDEGSVGGDEACIVVPFGHACDFLALELDFF